MDKILKQLSDFSFVLGEAKRLERFKGQFFWKDYPGIERFDSVADHSWRLAMLVLLLENSLAQKMDVAKALKMALVHDLPEILSGDDSPVGTDGTGNDSYAFNKEKEEEKYQREKASAEKIFKNLPKKLSKELYNLWMEYEKQESFESKIVKSLDKIEATIQVLEYRNGHMFPEHWEFTRKYGRKGSEIDPAIQEFGNLIVKEMGVKYKEFKK